MDYTKSFDRVPHPRFLYKLRYTRNTLLWIQDFLSDLTQTVVVNGIPPNTVPVTSIVPQGIALGRILFIMYIILKHKITV